MGAEDEDGGAGGGFRDIRTAPFAWAHREVLDAIAEGWDGQQRTTALGVYLTLAWLASEQHTPGGLTAFVRAIADRAGLGLSTTKRYLAEFEALGLVRVERRLISGIVNDANRYFLTDPPRPANETGGSASGLGGRSASGPGHPADGPQSHKQLVNKEEENHHQQAPAEADAGVVVELSEELVREGIDPRTAAELVAEAGPDLVDAWLAVDTWRAARSPAAVLIAHLRRRDPAPPPPETQWERYRRERGGEQRGAD